MILIISHRDDFTADYVVQQLNERKVEYLRFNCEDILKLNLSFHFDKDFTYSILNQQSFDSVWFRRTKLPSVKGLSDVDTRHVLLESEALLKNIFATVPAKWLSPPSSVYRAENKFLQLKTAQSLGFEIPPTLVTNSRSELSQFFDDNNNDVVIKPISNTRLAGINETSFIFTNLLTKDHMNSLTAYDLTPCIYQRNIPKEYELRITVVGDQVFSAAIDSQADVESQIDWRRKKLRFYRVDLPKQEVDLCRNLIRHLDLGFGAIDMIRTPDGRYVFLEVNPNGQWVWIESETALPITDAIINYLT